MLFRSYQDMLGGRVPMAFAIMASAMPLVRAGKLKGLAVTNAQRSVIYPEFPPIAATVPGYELTTWSGLMVAAGAPNVGKRTPRAICLPRRRSAATRMSSNRPPVLPPISAT